MDTHTYDPWNDHIGDVWVDDHNLEQQPRVCTKKMDGLFGLGHEAVMATVMTTAMPIATHIYRS